LTSATFSQAQALRNVFFKYKKSARVAAQKSVRAKLKKEHLSRQSPPLYLPQNMSTRTATQHQYYIMPHPQTYKQIKKITLLQGHSSKECFLGTLYN